MSQIHPTAMIDTRAELADDVYVGPHCVIEGRVTIGTGTRLIGNVYLQGPLTIGERNRVYPFSTFGFAPQDWKYDPYNEGSGAVIGSDNVFREGVTIHRATRDVPTTVGNKNYLMANAHIGHDCIVGSHCTLANSALLGGHVTLADHVIIGGNAAVHQFCRVGRLSMVSGGIGIAKDQPPFCTSYSMRTMGSINVIGVRRAGLSRHIPALHRAFHMLCREHHTNPIACDLIEQNFGHDPLCMEIVEFVRQSTRGILVYGDDREEGD